MFCTAAVAAGGIAAAAYLDGKYQLGRDLNYIRKLKWFEREYNKRGMMILPTSFFVANVSPPVKQDRISPWYILEETCKRQPNDRAIWTRERSWTWSEVHDYTVQLAQWMLDEGIRPGDLVAMYLYNSAEFLMIMFATLCIGAGPAMINYNLEGKALMHCLDVCNSKLFIVDEDADCQRRISGSREEIEGAGAKIVTLDAALQKKITSRPVVVPGDELRNGMTGEWPYALIYTSGTTGLPKGCPFLTSRMHLAGVHLEPPFGSKKGVDCWYVPMPLYHGTGLITASASLMSGVGLAIAPKFSVSNFWPDVYDSRSTLFIYVGETARYLLAAPLHPLERKHRLRCIYGNGLRPDVWQKFQERFNIPQVAEFFNSSEGVFGLVVWAKGPYLRACVGHHGGVFRALLRNTYVPVEFDYETGDIYRDPRTGFAKRVPYEEGGEILVAVPSKEAFGGYWRNPDATNKRFAADVFKKGDLYYRAGDALRRTPDGHWYFLDRLGDTFRWKSENVSTAEVSLALGRHPSISEANVYGVSVPGHEGRAGCAAVVLNSPNPDYADIVQYARSNLPRYAVPVFLRVVQRSSHIHNHKQNKVGLRKEGVDPDKLGTEEKEGVDDVFLWLRPGAESYESFTREEWDRLSKGEVRL